MPSQWNSKTKLRRPVLLTQLARLYRGNVISSTSLLLTRIHFMTSANGHHDISVRVFTNKEFVPNSFDMYLKASKINSYKELLMSSSLITRLASQVLMIAAVLIIVIQTRVWIYTKKNAKILIISKARNEQKANIINIDHTCMYCLLYLFNSGIIDMSLYIFRYFN